jgi:GxxExxY protein
MTASNRDERPRDAYPLQRLTRRINASFLYVHRSLGFGLSEAVYRRALAVELQYRGIAVAQEVPYEVTHRGVVVGTYRADLVAERIVILETKTGLVPDPADPGQLLSYLSASKLPIGLILHFGPRPTVKRLIRSEFLELARQSDRRRSSEGRASSRHYD